MRIFVLACLLLVPLAGCLSETDDRDDGTTPSRPMLPEDPMPEGPGHDHADPAQHKFLWNYDFSSRDPLLQNQASIAGVHALDRKGDYLFGAVYGSHAVAVDGGLVIWDLSDPAKPAAIGRFVVQGAVGGDRSMEATDDGDFVVLGTETITCLGQVNPTAFRAYLIDTTDKTRPVVADVITIGGQSIGSPSNGAIGTGTHSVTVHRIQDQDYAFIFGSIYRIERGEGAGATLVPTGSRVPVGHDLYVRDTPWGDVWGLTANGGGNFQIFDLSDPLAPVELAVFEDEEGHYLHTADVNFHPDGAITVILTSEDWGDVVSPMWIFDATGLAGYDGARGARVLEPVGMWSNPGGHVAGGLSFSLHNPRFDQGILTIANYHGGLFQLDFRHEALRAAPAEIAYAVYAEGTVPVQDPVQQTVEGQLCNLGLRVESPTYMDVETGVDGILYAADVYMGLYTFTPTADHPVYATD